MYNDEFRSPRSELKCMNVLFEGVWGKAFSNDASPCHDYPLVISCVGTAKRKKVVRRLPCKRRAPKILDVFQSKLDDLGLRRSVCWSV